MNKLLCLFFKVLFEDVSYSAIIFPCWNWIGVSSLTGSPCRCQVSVKLTNVASPKVQDVPFFRVVDMQNRFQQEHLKLVLVTHVHHMTKKKTASNLKLFIFKSVKKNCHHLTTAFGGLGHFMGIIVINWCLSFVRMTWICSMTKRLKSQRHDLLKKNGKWRNPPKKTRPSIDGKNSSLRNTHTHTRKQDLMMLKGKESSIF